MLNNLLSNAQKFSPPGSEITVGLAVAPKQLTVWVADRGVGIPREEIPALFVPFHRVRQASGKEVKGVGLGLYVSRGIVEAHGGRVWAHSEPGKGSTFYFTVPVVDRT